MPSRHDIIRSLNVNDASSRTLSLFFREGEAFEAFCPARLDELLREALRLEQHLKNQKERLRERLTIITRSLHSSVL